MMKKLKNEKGFTLLEMLLTVAISAMIFYTAFAVLRRGDEHMQTTQIKMHLQESARSGLTKLIEDLRQSSPTRITIGGGGATLQFQIPDSNNPVQNDFNINWAGSQTIQYARGGLNGTQLIRTNASTGITTVVANDVSAITFVGNLANPTVVTTTVSVQRVLLTGALMPVQPLQMTAQAEIRNT